MVAFALAMAGVLVLAGMTWIPPLLGKDSGVHVTRPGLLTVDEIATGEVDFPDGASITLSQQGFRLADAAGVLLDTVIQGSPVTAFTGTVTGSGGKRRENLTTVASNVRIEHRLSDDELARFTGYVYDDTERVKHALTIDIAEKDGRFRFIVVVKGVDAVVIHLRFDHDTVGYAPSVPDRNLVGRAWWVKNVWPASTPIFTTVRGVSVALGPATVDRALDLREPGRTDVHLWSDRVELGLTRLRPPVADSEP